MIPFIAGILTAYIVLCVTGYMKLRRLKREFGE